MDTIQSGSPGTNAAPTPPEALKRDSSPKVAAAQYAYPFPDGQSITDRIRAAAQPLIRHGRSRGRLSPLTRAAMQNLLEVDSINVQLLAEIDEIEAEHAHEMRAVYDATNLRENRLTDDFIAIRYERDALFELILESEQKLGPNLSGDPFHPGENVMARLNSERDAAQAVQTDLAEDIDREASQDESLRFTESDTVVPTKAGAESLKEVEF